MTELAIIETLTPAVFIEEGRLDKVIEDIKSRVANFNGDITTAKGRDEIKSFAFRIAKSKTALDNLGKECVEDWKKQSKVVDAERRRIWDIMEAMQKDVRKPVTDWEQAEETRVVNLKGRINNLGVPTYIAGGSDKIKQILADIEATVIDESFEELQEIAAQTKAATIITLQSEIAAAEKREADAAELAELRRLAEERAQKDRDEAIRKEAAERATREAEEKAKAEREAAEKREADAKAEAARKEKEAKLAAENAAKEAAEKIQKAEREKKEAEERAARAVEDERKKVAAENARVLAEEAKRDADKAHRRRVNSLIMTAFMNAGLTEDAAKTALKAIGTGIIPNIKLTY